MAEVQKQGVPLTTFTGGLNATSSLVNMESTDLADMDNIDLNTSGSLRRRKAIDFLGIKNGNFWLRVNKDYEGKDIAPAAKTFVTPDSSGVFKSFLALHIDTEVYLYDASDEKNLVDLNNPYGVVNISSYASSEIGFYKTRFIVDKGKLFLINKGLSFGYIYLNSSDVFEFVPITVTRRNLEKDNPDVSSLVNQDSKSYICIKEHTSSADNKPGSGEDWRIYWALWGGEITHSSVSSWASSTDYKTNVEALSNEFSAATFGVNRLWLAGSVTEPNTVYFSQTVLDDLQYGRMYQFADPLSTYDSETVATDGGSIVINGAQRILYLTEFKNGIIVFADNGVWYISGSTTDEVFSAVAFSIELVTDSGLIGERAVTQAGEYVIYFSYGSVFALSKEDYLGSLKVESIGDKIENLYKKVPLSNKASGLCTYNPVLNRVYFWCNLSSYPWMLEKNPFKQATHFRSCLILDLKLGAWFKYNLSEDTAGTAISIGDASLFAVPEARRTYIITSDKKAVTSNSGEYATSSVNVEDIEYLNLLVFINPQGSGWEVSLGKTDAYGFKDFSLIISEYVVDSVGNTVVDSQGNILVTRNYAEDYSSYAETAPFTFDVMLNKKQLPYIYFVFERTEKGVFNQEGEDISASSCLMRTIANWANSGATTKYSEGRQIYFPLRWTTGFFDGANTPLDTVTRKEKIRTRGNSLQLRFESKEDKNFNLLGLHMNVGVSERV